ncbi:MAG: class I SAM-dependent methyltransferase [Blastocatellia bacterium]
MSSSQAQHNASIVDQFTKQALPFSQMATQHEELLLDFSGVTTTETVLDVACGPGIVACAFATRARHVTGIDLTPAMLEQAKKRQRKFQLANLTWQLGDVLPLPFADGAFSMVITRYSFHHFLDPLAVCNEMLRVCQPGGTVMVVDATPPQEKAEAYNYAEKLKDPSHVRALPEAELVGVVEAAGLQDIKTQRYPFEVEFEASMKSFFPNPGDAEKIRQLFHNDVGKNALGLNVHRKGDAIHYIYPVLIVVGKKAA